MPIGPDGVTFTPLYNWEADYAASPTVNISPVRFDGQDADMAAALTAIFSKLSPAGLSAVMAVWWAGLPTSDPLVLNQPWNNGGLLSFSKGSV